jgi:hypothetical protein
LFPGAFPSGFFEEEKMKAASMEPPVFFSCDWCSVKCPSAFNLHQVSFFVRIVIFPKNKSAKIDAV